MPVRVVDASAVAALVFAEREAELVTGAFGDADLIAPNLLIFELTSVCLKKIRARPAEREGLVEALAAVDDLAIAMFNVSRREVLELAERTNLTAYDASYLWLALDRKAELVTLDKRLSAVVARLSEDQP